MPRPDERREFQRLNLNPTIAAKLGDVDVQLLEIGVLGARMKHEQPLGDADELRFDNGRGGEVVLRCQVVRTIDGESGVRFVSAIGESGDRLRELLAALVTEVLERTYRKRLNKLEPEIDGDRTIRGTAASYLSYRLEGGTWHKRRVFLPEQPPVGFTVARTTDTDDLQRLCRIYEVSDDEGRRLIRLFAELSVSEALSIPPTL